jgi:very-short-patch-repair endonuclease
MALNISGDNMLTTENNPLHESTPTLKKGVAEGGGILSYNLALKPASRKLRNNMTIAEVHLWQYLRKDQLGVRFYRQKPILDYIVDFYCPALKLIIEVDGGYHECAEQAQKDAIRETQLQKIGLTVLRFSNEQVLNQTRIALNQIKGFLPTAP